MLDYKSDNETLLADLVFYNPELSPTKILQLFGLKQALNVMSSRELRMLFAKYNQRAWYRLMSEANKVTLPYTQRHLEIVRKELTKFNPLKGSKSYK